MIRQTHTPEGIIERELTDQEVLELARAGDTGALIEWAKKNWPPQTSPFEKIDVLAAVLGIIPIPE